MYVLSWNNLHYNSPIPLTMPCFQTVTQIYKHNSYRTKHTFQASYTDRTRGTGITFLCVCLITKLLFQNIVIFIYDISYALLQKKKKIYDVYWILPRIIVSIKTGQHLGAVVFDGQILFL